MKINARLPAFAKASESADAAKRTTMQSNGLGAVSAARLQIQRSH